MEDVLDMISGFENGDFSKTLSSPEDKNLKPLVDKLNSVSKVLAAQAANDVSFIVDSLGIGIWKWDLISNSLEWDKNMYRLYGCDPKDFNGAYDAWETSLSAETKAKAVEEINIAVAGGKSFDTTFQVLQRNTGKIQEIRTRAFVIRDDAGKPLKMWGINIDRTREAELEKEVNATLKSLEATSKFLEQTGELAKVGGWELDLASGTVHMTQQTQLLHEIDKDYKPPLYSTGSEWYPPEAWPQIQAAVQAAIEQGKSYDLESPFITAKGRKIWVRVQGFPIMKDGKVTLLRGTFQDITHRKQKEEESKQLTTWLLDSQETAKIGSWKFDLKTSVLIWSSEHYRIFEIEEPQDPESLFKLYRDRIHPDDHNELDRVVEIALKSGEDYVYHHRVFLDDGARIKHVRGIGKVSKDKDGTPLHISGTCQDISDFVASKEQNDFILKTMGVGIWKFNPVSQELFWDQSLYELYELNPKDFSGHYQAWESSLSPENKQIAVQELQLALSGEKEFDTTFEILTKSGVRKYIGGKGVVIRNSEGQPIMMYGINWDQSKEIVSKNLFLDQKRLLDTVLENLPNMVFVKSFDENLRFKLFNRSGQKLLGVSEEQILGKNDFDFFPREQAEFFTSKDREVFQHHRVVRVDKEQINTPTGIRWLETYKVPTYKADGAPDLLIGISTDITEKLKLQTSFDLERAKSVHNAKLASLGEMAAGIAHEINNPLAIIVGSVDLVSKFRNDDTKFNSKLETITKSAKRIEKIVNGLKKFSRTSNSSIHKPETIASIVSESLILCEAKSKRHSTPIETHIDPELRITCDGVEIEQVFVNLINNGIDAIKDREDRWIKINAFADGAEVVLQVIDSGQGITTDIEQKLFQPFFTTKVVGEGTGLGLSISKGILNAHKASIELNRSIKNTCFEIRFAKEDQ